MITQKIDLNLIPGRVLPMVNVSQYDKDSRTLEFTIYNGDASFDLTGLSAYIQGLKPDGHGFNYSATVSSGKITADVTEQMTAVAGRVMCEIVIMSGTDRIGTGNFILNVEAAAMPDGSNMSDSEYSYIEQLIEDAQEAATDAEAWAVGERGGVPVDPTDPTYHNSAHYWAMQASGSVNDMVGATASTPGVHGLVPAPAAGDQDKVLKGDGTWGTVAGASDMTGATAGSAGTHGLVPAPAAGDQNKFLSGDGTWKNAPAGGHTIQNPSGTDMTQRAKLQFAGTGVSVTDDSVNNKTVVQFTGGGGGILPHIVITSEVGATVTLVNGGTTISTTETSSGIFEADIPSFGTWTITVLDGGNTYTQTIVIDTVKIYTATVTAFSATIMVTYPSGATCTCTGNGESYTASGTPYTFTVHSTGTFTITVTLDGVSKTDTMVITEDGQASAVTIKFGTINLTLDNEFVGLSITCVNGGTSISKTAGSTSLVFRPPTTGTWTMSGTVNGVTYSTDATISDLDTAASASLQTVPDGSTVLPTDDIQTWLACAGITDKAYTTLAEVLADSTTLLALISDNNAVDYMVRSKTFIGNVALVPTMTSNTTPSGEAFGFSEMSGNEYYKAFDGDDASYWRISAGTSSNAYVGYNFGSAKRVGLAKVIGNNGTPQSVKIQGSNDGTTWTDVSSVISIPAGVETLIPIDPSNTYSRFRVYWTNPDSGIAFGIRTIQFYSGDGICSNSTAMTDIGANNYAADTLLADSDWLDGISNSTYFESVLNVKVPAMTSNNAPSGVCSAQETQSTKQPYYAFDGNNSTVWYPTTTGGSSGSPNSKWLQYQFANSPFKLCRVDFQAWSSDTSGYREFLTRFKLEGSTDGSTFSEIVDDQSQDWGASTPNPTISKAVNSSTKYNYYRLTAYTYAENNVVENPSLRAVQFYGREDV